MVTRRLAILVLAVALLTAACSTDIRRRVDPFRVDPKDNGNPPACVEIITYAHSEYSSEDIRRDKYCLAPTTTTTEK